jgi:predicted peptidase
MEKKTMAKLIAVIGIVAIGMSLGCIGTTTIGDIKKNPDYLGEKVVVEGVLGHGSFMNAIGTTSGGIFVMREDKSFNSGLVKDIRVKYNGELPTDKKNGYYVSGTITKVKVTGIVENHNSGTSGWGKSEYIASLWQPHIRATSWEYI